LLCVLPPDRFSGTLVEDMKETPETDERLHQTSAADEQTSIGARAAELERLKAHFLAAMSHELRVPINSIIASTELLNATRLSAAQSEPVGSIRENCNAIIRIIEDMSRFAQIRAANVVQELTNFWFATRFDGLDRLTSQSDKPQCGGRALAPKAKPGTPAG
jgi:signal transduction histidine kinase